MHLFAARKHYQRNRNLVNLHLLPWPKFLDHTFVQANNENVHIVSVETEPGCQFFDVLALFVIRNILLTVIDVDG